MAISSPNSASFLITLQEAVMELYEAHGLRILYPQSWTLEHDGDDRMWELTAQSPDVAFVSLFGRAQRLDAEEVLDEALQSITDDRSQLEMVETEDQIAGLPAPGYDLHFFSMDIPVFCRLRCFRTDSQTLLLMCQTSDLDADQDLPKFLAIQDSIELL